MNSQKNIFTTLIILQIGMVLLLGVMVILNYQAQAEIQGLRRDLAEVQGTGGAGEPTVADRLAALELRAGMRNPRAAQATAALQRQMAEASDLQKRIDEMGAGSPGASSLPKPPPILSEAGRPAPAVATPQLSPAEQAVSQLPVVAEILTYDADWRFYTISKGQLDGVRASGEYGVRKKDSFEIIARLRIDRLHPQDAVAELVKGSQNEGGPEAGPGDLLVDISSLQK